MIPHKCKFTGISLSSLPTVSDCDSHDLYFKLALSTHVRLGWSHNPHWTTPSGEKPKTKPQTNAVSILLPFSIIRAESEHFLNLAFALSSRSGWWPTRLDLFLHSFYCPSRWVFDYILCWFRFYSQASLRKHLDEEDSLDHIYKIVFGKSIPRYY